MINLTPKQARQKWLFFHQLAILARTRPVDGMMVREVTEDMATAVRTMAAALTRSLDSGQPFADAMNTSPEWFDEYDILLGRRLQSVDDKKREETLLAMAKSAELEYLRPADLRDTFYPVLMVLGGIWIVSFWFFYSVVWGFRQIYIDQLEGEPLPGLTHFFVVVAELAHDPMFWLPMLTIPLGMVLAIWIGDRNMSIPNFLFRFIAPVRRRSYTVDMFRIHTAVAVSFESELALTDSFAMVASITEDENLQEAIQIAPMGADDLGECIKQLSMDSRIPPHLADCLSEAVTRKDGSSLWNLGMLMGENATYRITWPGIVACALIFATFISVIGICAISLYMPFIRIVE